MKTLLPVRPIQVMGEELSRGPGKFEGGPRYAHFFYEAMLEGDGEYMENNSGDCWQRIELDTEDLRLWPELTGLDYMDVREDDNGFIYTKGGVNANN